MILISLPGENGGEIALRLPVGERKDADFGQRQQKVTNHPRLTLGEPFTPCGCVGTREKTVKVLLWQE